MLPPVGRELRDMTRYRKRLIQDRTRETQRVDKVLQDAPIKLGAVASETLGVSSRAMIAGERDPAVLAGLARGRLRVKIPDPVRALHGRFAAFVDEFDCPPSRFMRAWALDCARRRLQQADPRTLTVTEVAADLGINHLGRFAGDYRHIYGESPSATLRSTAEATVA